MDERTPGNPFQSDTFELYAPTSIDSPLQKKTLSLFGNRYLISQVRRGGMGEVFLCKPASMEKGPLLALKSFQKRFFFDPNIRDAFIREIQIWSQLSSLPYILPVLGLEHLDDRPFIVMKGIEPSPSGVVTLRDLLKQHPGPLPKDLMLGYAYQIAAGMATAQQGIANLVHGDLKPENLLLMNETLLYISDFGLARVINESTQDKYSLDSTWAYRASESWKSPRTVSQASDIYAFGAILYEMLTGELLYHARTREEWSHAHQIVHPSPPQGIPKDDIAAACMTLALRCLAKESEDRPQGFGPILRELERLNVNQGHVKTLQLANSIVEQPELKAHAISVLLAGGQHKKALEELEKISWDVLDSQLWHLLGNALSLNGKDSEAVSAFRWALIPDPTNPLILSDYALSLKRLERFEEAIAVYESILTRVEDDESYVIASVNLATVYIESHRPKEAVNLLTALLRRYPQSPNAWANLGEAYHRLGRYDDALACFHRALVQAPYASSIQLRMASILMDDLGRTDEALVMLELAAAQGLRSKEWNLRFLACQVILGNEKYATRHYHELAHGGSTPTEIAELQDAVRHRVQHMSDVRSKLGADGQSSPSDESTVISTRALARSERPLSTNAIAQDDQRADQMNSRMLQDAQDSAQASNNYTLSDGQFGEDAFSVPFLNIHLYVINSSGEYSIDFYDDVNKPEYVDHFLTEWRRTIRTIIPPIDSHFTLKPNLFYFTVCPNCEIAILSNRDQGNELKCRRCGIVHNTTIDKRNELLTLLTRVHTALGRAPVSLKGLIQVLLIQPFEASDMPIVEVICTEADFIRVPEGSFMAKSIWNEGRQRGLFRDDLPFSVWQKIAKDGERADSSTPPEVYAVVQKLRRFISVRSLSTLLDTMDTSITSLIEQDKLNQAEAALQEKLRKGEDITETLALLTEILISQERYSEAQEKIAVLLQLRPEDEKGWTLSGMLEMEREQYKDAVAALERARSINPVNWRTLLSLARCYDKLGDNDKAGSYAALARSLGEASLQI